MTGNFAQSAKRMAGIAARLLGWAPDAFWKSTPEEIATALSDPAQDGSPPSRDQVYSMMERDKNGR